MRIAAVDLFYLAMPRITAAADGTQDTLLVRVRDESGLEGWGECDASPLVSMAAYVCPTSHGNIVSLDEILLGERLDDVADVARIGALVRRRALDVAQAHHAFAGADMALWDLLGKRLGEPVWRLLERLDGATDENAAPCAKEPYASVLFQDTPEETRRLAAELRGEGFRAAKFGWGPLGQADATADVALVRAARDGLGAEARLMVDAGVAWGEDDLTAYERSVAFAPIGIDWLEEPLAPDAVEAYRRLAERGPPVAIAAGEGADRYRFAEDILVNGRIGTIQIDAGRIGGITTAFRVRRLAERRGATYVNHTFKSHLSLAAALHVFATASGFELLEYPVRSSELATRLVADPLARRADGRVTVPDAPGLGVSVDRETVRRFHQPVRIEVAGRVLLESDAAV